MHFNGWLRGMDETIRQRRCRTQDNEGEETGEKNTGLFLIIQIFQKEKKGTQRLPAARSQHKYIKTF